MRASENYTVALDEGDSEYLINSYGEICAYEKTTTGTISVNIQRNSTGSALEIVLLDTSYNIISTKSISGTGTRQFLQVPAGSYYVYIRNNGSATVLTVNVYY